MDKNPTVSTGYRTVIDGVDTNYGTSPEGFAKSLRVANRNCFDTGKTNRSQHDVDWYDGDELITSTRKGDIVKGE
jgi:hypothetical protein